MRRLISLACFVALVANAPAHAQFMDGNKLLAFCQEQPGGFGDGICAGYAAGVADGLVASQALPPGGICMSNAATVRQARDLILKHIQDNPQTRHGSAGFMGAVALATAFPCPAPTR
jgi:hypothetical protein